MRPAGIPECQAGQSSGSRDGEVAAALPPYASGRVARSGWRVSDAQEELAAFAARPRFASDDGLPTSTDAIFLAEALAEENQKENSPPHSAPRSPIKALFSPSPLGSRPGTPTAHSPSKHGSPGKTAIPKSGHLIASLASSPLRCTTTVSTGASPARIPPTALADDAPGFSPRREEDEFLSVALNMAGSPVVEGAIPGGVPLLPHDGLRGISSWVLPEKPPGLVLPDGEPRGEIGRIASHPITGSRSVSVSPPQRAAFDAREGDGGDGPSAGVGESGSDSGPEWVAFQDVAGASGAPGVDSGLVRSAFAPCDGDEEWEDGEPPPHTFDHVYLTFGAGDRRSSGVVGPPLESRPSQRDSDKFQAEEGEDAEIKQLLWVVENLQEELMAANEARIKADAQLPALRKEVEALQEEVEAAVVAEAEVSEEMHTLEIRLAELLDLKTLSDEAYRQNTAELRQIHERTAEVDIEISLKTARMDALRRKVAEIKRAAAGKQAGPPGQELRSRALADLGSDSDHSHVSSAWGTDTESDDDEDLRAEGPIVADSSPGVKVTQVLEPAPDAFRRPSIGAAPSGWLRGVFGKPGGEPGTPTSPSGGAGPQ